MPTHLDRPLEYIEDDPHRQESRLRRYAWSALLYLVFGALIVGLFLLVR